MRGMSMHKSDDFRDRLSTAANARKAALEKFRSRPGPDDPAVIERQAAQLAIQQARDARIQERKAAREAEAARQAAAQAALVAEEKARAARSAADKEAAAQRAAAIAAERKAARDARYAARNARRR
jgi:hypothetical protein